MLDQEVKEEKQVREISAVEEDLEELQAEEI